MNEKFKIQIFIWFCSYIFRERLVNLLDYMVNDEIFFFPALNAWKLYFEKFLSIFRSPHDHYGNGRLMKKKISDDLEQTIFHPHPIRCQIYFINEIHSP